MGEGFGEVERVGSSRHSGISDGASGVNEEFDPEPETASYKQQNTQQQAEDYALRGDMNGVGVAAGSNEQK